MFHTDRRIRPFSLCASPFPSSKANTSSCADMFLHQTFCIIATRLNQNVLADKPLHLHEALSVNVSHCVPVVFSTTITFKIDALERMSKTSCEGWN